MAICEFEQDGHVVTITLNRPDAHNALNMELRRGIADAIARFDRDHDARVAILTGAGGKAFSAGADLKEMTAGRLAQRANDRGEGDADAPRPSPANDRATTGQLIIDINKPVIAAIDGWCLAGGFELAMSCDLRVAGDQSTFGLTEVTRGIVASGGGTSVLPRLIPPGLALEVLLTGRHCTAEEAYRWGAVNRLVPAGTALAAAREMAELIAANGPIAVQATKRAVREGLDMDLAGSQRLGRLMGDIVGRTEDALEGPKAFTEKRPAVFKGR